MSILPFLQSLFGWIYFFAWSATFWPQVILMARRRTTAGLSTDFVAINIVGFCSYAIFTFTSYSIPSVRESYEKATGHIPQVDSSDVLFATHGAIMCVVMLIQLLTLPPRIPPKRYVLYSCVFFQIAVVLGLFFAIVGKLDWYQYLRAAGMVKVLSSFVKHFPQVWLNNARKSTVGWSFTMVLLDIVGGSFSMAQQTVRALRINSWAPFSANPAKTFLAVESLLFDFYFVIQHVFFYPDHTDIDRQNLPLTTEERPQQLLLSEVRRG